MLTVMEGGKTKPPERPGPSRESRLYAGAFLMAAATQLTEWQAAGLTVFGLLLLVTAWGKDGPLR